MGVFEEATNLAARQLARYRTGWDDLDAEPTENERLLAGHVVGNLMANHLINMRDEKWVSISSENDLK